MRAAWVIGIAAVLLAARAGHPAEQAEEPPSKWTFEALPYAWLFGFHGSLTVKGNTVKIDVPPGDTWDLLTGGNAFAGSGYFSAAYDRFSFFTDAVGGYLEAGVTETIPTQLCTLSISAKDKVKVAFADFAFGYELGQWALPNRKRPFTLGVYAGTRYMWFQNKLDATAGVVHGAERKAKVIDVFQWADPMIGLRWSLPALDSVSIDFRGDIGGFHASSDLIWGLVGTTRYWVPWHPYGIDPYLLAGYRAVVFDRSNTSASIDLQFRGPMMGAGFTF